MSTAVEHFTPNLGLIQQESLIIAHAFCGSDIWECLEQFHLRVTLEVEIAVECFFGVQSSDGWTRAEDPLLRWFNHKAGKLVVAAGGRF